MRSQISILFFVSMTTFLSAQVELEPDKIAVNIMNPISTVAVNDVGIPEAEMFVQAEANMENSTAVYGKAFDITASSERSQGVWGVARFAGTSNRAVGVRATALRDQDYNSGRSYGIISVGGNSYPGANFGVLSYLHGGNAGAAVVGVDNINHPGFGELLSGTVSYAGYFRGKGYFHDYVGFGEDDPAAKVHVRNGDVYVEGSANGIILDSGSGCFKIQVDAAGVLSTIAVTCP